MMCMDPLIEPLPAVTVSHLATVSARPLLSVRHQTLSYPLPPAAADALSPEREHHCCQDFHSWQEGGAVPTESKLVQTPAAQSGSQAGRAPVRPGRAGRQIQQTKHRPPPGSPDWILLNRANRANRAWSDAFQRFLMGSISVSLFPDGIRLPSWVNSSSLIAVFCRVFISWNNCVLILTSSKECGKRGRPIPVMEIPGMDLISTM